MEKIQVYLMPELIKTIDVWAKENGMNRGQAIRFMILDFLKRVAE